MSSLVRETNEKKFNATILPKRSAEYDTIYAIGKNVFFYHIASASNRWSFCIRSSKSKPISGFRSEFFYWSWVNRVRSFVMYLGLLNWSESFFSIKKQKCRRKRVITFHIHIHIAAFVFPPDELLHTAAPSVDSKLTIRVSYSSRDARKARGVNMIRADRREAEQDT